MAERKDFDRSEARARERDAADPLGDWRRRFLCPSGPDGSRAAYFTGHSLGLQPVATRELVLGELERWAADAVDGHFGGDRPWYSYHEFCREPLARLVGARPDEVVAMNTLTVNLHLMMVSFYRPTAERGAIVIEEGAFPSDLYAVQSQLRHHGRDPERDLILIRPRDGETRIREEDVEAWLRREGERVALVLWPGVQYVTGQAFDLARIARAAHEAGALCGVDLAHAAGNLPLSLHDDGVDFAVWCSYKYLNSGPGATAGAFVHARHGEDDLPRFAGWWGNDPAKRFRMASERSFEPVAGADGWQLSNPPILATAPLIASLAAFDEAGMPALREKSLRLTAELERWIREAGGDSVRMLTPEDPARRGAQLSFRWNGDAAAVRDALGARGIVVDVRQPDILRIAPVPFYVSFHDVWRCGTALAAELNR